MDAWWERLIRAVYDPVVGDAGRIPIGFDNAPGLQGSAYQDGFYGYLWTDLSMALGDSVKSPTSRIYCGGTAAASGSLGACAPRVLESLVAAGDALAGEQGGDPAAWAADAEGERIRFLPGAALSMHWVNRPTTQQIAMFGAKTPPCARASAFKRVGVRPRRRGLRFLLRPVTKAPVTVVVRRVAAVRRIGRAKRVKRFGNKQGSFTWRARGARLGRGHYVVSFRTRARDGSVDVRRAAVRHMTRRFKRAPAVERRRTCSLVRSFAIGRPVFGGAGRPRALVVSTRLSQTRRASILVRRRGRVVKRFRTRILPAGKLRRTRIRPAGLPRGKYKIVLKQGRRRLAALSARRL
jgi:hypothetical protein